MTDRTPASPVEVLARALHDAGIGCKPNVVYCRASHRGHAGRILAALQAQDHTITKGGLDVERLARAMNNVLPWIAGQEAAQYAGNLAREYAALEPTHD